MPEGDFGDVGGLGDLVPPSHAVFSSDGSSAMLSLLFSTPDLSAAEVASIVSISPIHQDKIATKIRSHPNKIFVDNGQLVRKLHIFCANSLSSYGKSML